MTVITTIRKVTIDLENKAKQIAKDLSIPYVTRNNLGIDKIKTTRECRYCNHCKKR